MKLHRLTLLLTLSLLADTDVPMPASYILKCSQFPTHEHCNEDSEFICGTDGQDYGNACILCEYNRLHKKDVRVLHLGFCTCDQKARRQPIN
ncbi:trypsin inhibitor ClTI-1-like [Hemiscyllium ocellatum]|uniref:trypsin inhibitor ClTI-1-like n=1 Tax=Hemiscyllium ocellatum TaxID=170820 RepID=UPI00296686C9|nr:trypsin inhibitor ClTI-1-like [Hemiscyllium ocellatum]